MQERRMTVCDTPCCHYSISTADSMKISHIFLQVATYFQISGSGGSRNCGKGGTGRGSEGRRSISGA